MEIIEETMVTNENVLVANDQPEFVENSRERVSARYFVICEENVQTTLPKNAFECTVAGLTLAEWTARACGGETLFLRAKEGEDVLNLVRPYAVGAEYSVVLYANTPLLRKNHLNDLLCFAARRHLSVCKLKRGYILKNDYIGRTDKLLSIDTYDLSSDDFFEVCDIRDFEYAGLLLKRRVLDFHNKNQVILDGRNVTIDASVELGYHTELAGGVAVIKKTKIGADCYIGANATISGSKLGDDVTVGVGAIVVDSVVKDGATIEAGAIIENSVVGERSTVKVGALVSRSGLKQNVSVGERAVLSGARVAENSTIKAAAKVVFVDEPVAIFAGATVGEGAEIASVSVAENAVVEPFAKFTKNSAGER